MLFILLIAILSTNGNALPLGNSMNPEHHATELVPMIEGTNVPIDEEPIDAPIYDDAEFEKIKGSVQDIKDNQRTPENLTIGGISMKDVLSSKNSTITPTSSSIVIATSPMITSTLGTGSTTTILTSGTTTTTEVSTTAGGTTILLPTTVPTTVQTTGNQ